MIEPVSSETSEGWTFKPLAPGTRWLTKLILSRLVKSRGTYQPIILNGRVLRQGGRDCVARWSVIDSIMVETDSQSMLDIGCAEGYFVRHAAKHGRVALGIDGDIRSITIAQSLALLEGLSGAAFMHLFITPEIVRSLPQFDTVIFLSVLHHVLTDRGPDEAHKLMQAIHSATRKRLIFDMGQSNETTYPWSKILPPMVPDPASWISQFLLDCGFSSVQVIGQSDGYLQAHPRLLFVATP